MYVAFALSILCLLSGKNRTNIGSMTKRCKSVHVFLIPVGVFRGRLSSLSVVSVPRVGERSPSDCTALTTVAMLLRSAQEEGDGVQFHRRRQSPVPKGPETAGSTRLSLFTETKLLRRI